MEKGCDLNSLVEVGKIRVLKLHVPFWLDIAYLLSYTAKVCGQTNFHFGLGSYGLGDKTGLVLPRPSLEKEYSLKSGKILHLALIWGVCLIALSTKSFVISLPTSTFYSLQPRFLTNSSWAIWVLRLIQEGLILKSFHPHLFSILLAHWSGHTPDRCWNRSAPTWILLESEDNNLFLTSADPQWHEAILPVWDKSPKEYQYPC